MKAQKQRTLILLTQSSELNNLQSEKYRYAEQIFSLFLSFSLSHTLPPIRVCGQSLSHSLYLSLSLSRKQLQQRNTQKLQDKIDKKECGENDLDRKAIEPIFILALLFHK